MLEVYLDPATINSRKVLAGLELLGTPYHVNHVNYFAGAHKQPDYLALNPNGTLPAAKGRRLYALGIRRHPAIRGRREGFG
jgi:glutathione S-transferase